MKLGIKDGKIYDICSELINKRDNSINDKDYLDLPMDDWCIGDSINSDGSNHLKDSPIRSIPPPKTELELLQEKNAEFETRIAELEAKAALEAAK